MFINAYLNIPSQTGLQTDEEEAEGTHKPFSTFFVYLMHK